ncbi:MAG TPA: GAF domain-containing sensor histidine kinase [Anaerolineales bacterium]|nr:GAF domain-containing sensor histidine kinase [Anaerolineales bacterium]
MPGIREWALEGSALSQERIPVTLGKERGILATMNSPLYAASSQTSPSIWLNVARVFQVIIICLTVGLFIMSIPLNYEQRSVVCEAEPCPPGQLTYKSESALAQIGMTIESLVKLTIGYDILLAAVFTVCAIVIFIRKPNDSFTIFVTVMLVTFGVATISGGIRGIGETNPAIHLLTETIAFIGNCSIIAFLFVFPNGKFSPGWTYIILTGWILFQLPRYYLPDSPLNLAVSSPALYNLLFPLGILVGIASQIHRYVNVSSAIEKQQTKWVIYGLTISMVGFIVIRELSARVQDPYGSGFQMNITLTLIAILFILLIPLSISVAVIRYRLWDINPIINRTLVYGALSASTIALYVLAVGFASRYFQGSNFIFAFIATGIIAILFEPLRARLQRAVNRLMYGERDDPATVLTRLSQRLDSTLAPDSVLQTIVETLAQALRLPYAAISLSDNPSRFASTRNLPPTELISIPLTYQTERVGELILAPRAEGESFSTADMNLLNIIARQAGIAAHNLRLTQDLQRSREKLVTAQEEERRRLRRDLHDGVGPTLASFSQRLDTAADLVNTNPEASIDLLKDLKGQVKNTVTEIRRLVYALRPPVLDEFGLVTAIREHVAPYTGPHGLQITFDVTEPMPTLPAAVEVATYRIALEAFTNIINHAQATACHITMKIENNSLLLEISDNGKGFSSNNHSGVGLTSMRERAAELGGEFIVENNPTGGTRVTANLPLSGSTATRSAVSPMQ